MDCGPAVIKSKESGKCQHDENQSEKLIIESGHNRQNNEKFQ